MIIVNFIRDPNVGIWARVKRPGRAVREQERKEAEKVRSEYEAVKDVKDAIYSNKRKTGELDEVELDGGCADEDATKEQCVKRE